MPPLHDRNPDRADIVNKLTAFVVVRAASHEAAAKMFEGSVFQLEQLARIDVTERHTALRDLGLTDVLPRPLKGPNPFTYWDYRAGMFHQDLGMRIDLILAGAPIAERVRAAWVDRQARKGSGPSDHAPVIVDLDEAPDGDIGPVVPPPSAPAARRGSVKLPQAP